MSSVVRIGLLGHGTVGAAFAGLLPERAAQVEATTGRRPEITGVLTRSQGDWPTILAGSDVVVELLGGLEPARGHVLEALRSGRHVVTANKQLLAEHGDELAAAARAGGAQLLFEAAVGGVVPVVRVLKESLAATRVERVHGIVNGTTNFILTRMADTGASYADALAEAQALGYAEADPTDDVTGKDAAAKMVILARLAFGTPVSLSDVRYDGITEITGDDLAYARELGLGLKLVGTAERVNGGLSVHVYPTFLQPAHPLASVHGPFNAVTIESEAITEITLSGPGAGGLQTASAVLGDVVSAIQGRGGGVGWDDGAEPLHVVEDVVSAFYLHLEVADRPGVLAQIAQVLGLQNISVKSVVQRGTGEGARLVMVVHPVRESQMQAAADLIAGLDFTRARPRTLRVLDEAFV